MTHHDRGNENAQPSGPVPIKQGLFTMPDSTGKPPQLIGSRCRACGEVYFPPRRVGGCPNCYELDMEEILLSNRGKIESFSIIHQGPVEWQGPVPYVAVTVELPEIVLVITTLTECDPADVKIGMDVELTLEKVGKDKQDNDILGYKFRPV